MTLFNTNLVFGPETFFMHYLAQCSLVGKVGYANLAPKDHLNFRFNPVSSNDVATAVDYALDGDSKGRFGLAGPEQACLRSILNTIEAASGRSVSAPSLPGLDYLNDFFYGTAADLNMSRMIENLEENPELANQMRNTWNSTDVSMKMGDFYPADGTLDTESLASPPLSQYKKMDLD